ncbi:hypothetical protein ABEB36_000527 [Hypothenemus hampei]|uniref:Uncharacterized protein n=1 Tax=Hypothenemus hampei TaxID=57062 RepID=A0ABD1FBJ3_HYPHA
MHNRLTVVLTLIGYVSSAKLDNLQYLPPQGNSIQQPQPPKSGDIGGQYNPNTPSGFQPKQPTNQYGSPSQQTSNQFAPPQNTFAGSQNTFAGSQNTFAPQQPKSPLNDVPILRLDSENPGDGTYRYAYETGNDIAAQEEGSAQSGWNKAQGSYRFVSPEGQNFEITYTADENGYVPQGAHLPTPPPIPDAILKSLEVIRQAEASGNILEGAYQPEGDDGQYRESHDEGQYQPQQSFNAPGVDSGKSAAPQGFATTGRQRPSGFSAPQQPVAPNGSYRY